jgi:hypothetical protein
MRYTIFLKILNTTYDLVSCPRYSYINIGRLSSIGAFRWVLRLLSYAVKRGKSLTSDEWKFPEITASMAAEIDMWTHLQELSNHDFPYFAIFTLFKIAHQEVRVLNLDPLNQIIDAIQSTFTAVKDNTPDNDGNCLSAVIFWRLVLIRCLLQILQDSCAGIETPSKNNIVKAILDVINVKLLALILSKTNDEATYCLTLRIFGLLIEINPTVLRDFLAIDGFKLLQHRFCDSFPFALIAISIFFRIPLSAVPYVSEVEEIESLCVSLLTDNCPGPNFTDLSQTSDYLMPSTLASDFIIPFLGYIIDCIHSSFDGLDNRQANISHFILAILRQAYERFPLLRKFLIPRISTDKVIILCI